MPSDLDIFAREPLTLEAGGQVFTIPWRPAAEWGAALRAPDALAAQLLNDGDREELARMLLDGVVTAAAIEQASNAVLAAASGWKWWEAARLVATSAARDVYGGLALAGVDPWRVSLAEWCAATYALLVKNREGTERMKLDMLVSVPPRGFEDEWDDGGDDPAETEAMLARMMGG